MLLLFDACLNIGVKAITSAVTPQILCTLFYSENFFISTCNNSNKKNQKFRYFRFSRGNSETVADINLILAPNYSLGATSW